MNDKLATELLAMHADVLVKGDDTTALLAQRYPELADLLHIAQQLGRAFAMLPVPEPFRLRLYHELARTPVAGPAPTRQVASFGWVAGAALGSAVTGLAVWLAHRSPRAAT